MAPAKHSLVLAKKFRGHYRIVKDRIKIPGRLKLPAGSAFQGAHHSRAIKTPVNGLSKDFSEHRLWLSRGRFQRFPLERAAGLALGRAQDFRLHLNTSPVPDGSCILKIFGTLSMGL